MTRLKKLIKEVLEEQSKKRIVIVGVLNVRKKLIIIKNNVFIINKNEMKDFNLRKYLAENKLLKENRLFSK